MYHVQLQGAQQLYQQPQFNRLQLLEYITVSVVVVLLLFLVVGFVVLLGVSLYKEGMEGLGKKIDKPLVLGSNGILLGVLDGISEYLSIHVFWVRSIFTIGGVIFFDLPVVVLIYSVLYLYMRRVTNNFICAYQGGPDEPDNTNGNITDQYVHLHDEQEYADEVAYVDDLEAQVDEDLIKQQAQAHTIPPRTFQAPVPKGINRNITRKLEQLNEQEDEQAQDEEGEE